MSFSTEISKKLFSSEHQSSSADCVISKLGTLYCMLYCSYMNCLQWPVVKISISLIHIVILGKL